ncbi:hypothetical protein J5Y09_01520 [Roseomonas sp. PWR1]|uniref:Uncharacterized protein n=1 Tax=Roseomonas nitratireducens TaxID=2820810 RepID=A0ABS4AMK8_9PROT|nr:hypothetical protein [Neoroseomonas nitratireducens]MBP0462578.1 hypothetical protein [Neoroseomonas nitratireducens]
MRSGTDRAAYRRWHAWAAGYRAAVLARRGQAGAALGVAAAAFGRDALWPARFLAQAAGHLAGRAGRRGAAV